MHLFVAFVAFVAFAASVAFFTFLLAKPTVLASLVVHSIGIWSACAGIVLDLMIMLHGTPAK